MAYYFALDKSFLTKFFCNQLICSILENDISDFSSSSSSSANTHSDALINPLGSTAQITNLAEDNLLQETIIKGRKESNDEKFNIGKKPLLGAIFTFIKLLRRNLYLLNYQLSSLDYDRIHCQKSRNF